MKLVSTLLVRRGLIGEAPSWSRFEVAYESGQSVLDGLRQIRAESDPTLAFRYSCISANACKECLILVDGEVAYACTARLEPRSMVLEPLPNKALLRDLATDIAPPDERLARISTTR
jgi:succinate dehydrogenase/fumarate reductase-like Fe-S protein